MDSLSKQHSWSILLNKNITILLQCYISSFFSFFVQPCVCSSHTMGCLSHLCCAGRISFCVCLRVHDCMSEGLGRQLAEAFFQCTRLGEPPLQLWLMRSCCWPCRGQSMGTRRGWCLFVVRNRLGQGALVVKHLNPRKHSSGSDFLLGQDTSGSLFALDSGALR